MCNLVKNVLRIKPRLKKMPLFQEALHYYCDNIRPCYEKRWLHLRHLQIWPVVFRFQPSAPR